MEKITQKDYFNAIKAVLNGEETTISYEDMVKFVDSRLALLDKKTGSRKPTATQVANEGYKATILEVLSDEGMTATEVLKSHTDFEDMSNQKISSLLNALVKEGKVVKETDKNKTLFRVA